MPHRDFEQGRIDATKQKDHEAEGHDQGILHEIFSGGKDCHYNPPSGGDAKKDYDEGYRYEKNKR